MCEPIKPTAEVFFTHTHVLHEYKIPYTFSTLSPDSHSLALSLHPPICFSIGLMRGSDKSSHMQMHREHDLLLIILCETTPDKNGDPAPFAKRKSPPASESIKYGRFPLLIYTETHTHTYTHTTTRPPSPMYLYRSRRHQRITFIQNASITRKTKRPCQGGSCRRRRQTILRRAHLSSNQPVI